MLEFHSIIDLSSLKLGQTQIWIESQAARFMYNPIHNKLNMYALIILSGYAKLLKFATLTCTAKFLNKKIPAMNFPLQLHPTIIKDPSCMIKITECIWLFCFFIQNHLAFINLTSNIHLFTSIKLMLGKIEKGHLLFRSFWL